MTNEEAIKWLQLQASIQVRWDDDSKETEQTRTECERRIRKAYQKGIEALKTREPKLVINVHKAHDNVLNPNVPWIGKCPKCGKKIEGKTLTSFCKYCGQAVAWE